MRDKSGFQILKLTIIIWKIHEVYVWAAIGVETRELLDIDASYQRSGLNACL